MGCVEGGCVGGMPSDELLSWIGVEVCCTIGSGMNRVEDDCDVTCKEGASD